MSATPARLLLATALAVFAAAVHAALGPSYGGTLRVGVLDLPQSASPALPAGAGERLLARLVHDTLVHLEGETPEPALAASWTAAEDGREWRLALRPATFHDGTALGARDVVRSLRRFLRGPSPSAAHLAEQLDGGAAFRSGDASELPGLVAGEDWVALRFHSSPASPLAPLASPAAGITSAGGSGLGPFVPTVADPGERFDMTAFSAHVRGRPFLSRVLMLRFGTREEAAQALEREAVDMAVTGRAPQAPGSTLILRLDPSRAPFDRAGIRSAIARSLARDRIAPVLGSSSLPTRRLLPWVPAAPAAPGPLPARLLRGRATLAVARDVPATASRMLVAHFAALGLELHAAPYPPGALPPAPILLRFWEPELPDPLLAARELVSLAPAPAAAHRELRQATLSADPVERRLLLDGVAAAVEDHAVLIPVAVAPLSFETGPGVHGVAYAGSTPLLEDAWREIDPDGGPE
jgi:ABC-type transport system substrate-binding protein